MDQELVAFLEQRFQGIETRFVQIETRFDQIDTRFDQIDTRFDQVDDKIRQVDDKVNLARVEIESVRGEIRQVAEGVAANTEKLDAFRVEVAQEFAEVRTTSRLQYSDLDRRVRRLEVRVFDQA
jgi:chromosome segregation ATPase